MNASKTGTMIVSCHAQFIPMKSTPLTLDKTVLEESADLVRLGEEFDAKMAFEKHLRSVSRATERLCITRKFWQMFHGPLILRFSVLSCRS